MQAMGILQQALGLAQAVGGCIPEWKIAMGVISAAGITSSLLSIFGAGNGDDPVAAALKQTQEALENDLNELAKRIGTDVMNAFGEEHQVHIETAQQWLTGEYGNFDSTFGIHAASLDKATYISSILPNIISSADAPLGSQSPLRDACNFVTDTDVKNQQLGQAHAFLSLYMSAATLYLNYATFYSSLQWKFDCQDYLNSNPPDPLNDPNRPTMKSTLIKYETVSLLGQFLDDTVAYLSKQMTVINNAYTQRQASMTSEGSKVTITPASGGFQSQNPDNNSKSYFFDSNNAQRYVTLKNAQYRYAAYRSNTDSLHLDLLATPDIQLLNQTLLTLYKAQCDYHDLVGDPKPTPLNVPTPIYPAQGLVGLPNITTNPPVIYIVQQGDTLSSIAQRYYGDPIGWEPLFDANRTIIGGSPNTLSAGMMLTIPPVTQAQIDALNQMVAEHQLEQEEEFARKHGGNPGPFSGGGGIGIHK